MILKSISLPIFLVFALSVAAQVNKPVAKPKSKATPSPIVKSQPSVIGEVTTTDGRRVILKTDKTWEYIPVPIELPQIKVPEETNIEKFR